VRSSAPFVFGTVTSQADGTGSAPPGVVEQSGARCRFEQREHERSPRARDPRCVTDRVAATYDPSVTIFLRCARFAVPLLRFSRTFRLHLWFGYPAALGLERHRHNPRDP
jgi:hypothetical protein